MWVLGPIVWIALAVIVLVVALFVLPFWPIAAGLAFAALAANLRHGSTLQRDTGGLV